MRNKLILYMVIALVTVACKKDLGNYDYDPPSEPILAKFQDSTFKALVGDTLTIKPIVQIAGADYIKDLDYQWDILVPEEARAATYHGYPLKMVYNLSPQLRTAKLTITDKRNNIKYFFPFKILGSTQFSVGTTVLSVANGVTKLSFVKPNNTVIPDLYRALNEEDLPANPTQLFAKPLAYQANTVEDYWVIGHDATKQNVVIDGNTMLRKRYFADQFFIKPATIDVGLVEASMGIPTAVINGKLYIAVTTTAPFAPDFGKFSNMQSGNYTLSKYFSRTPVFYFGFDTAAKAFVSFDGGGNYMGSDYAVSGTGFDPKKIGSSDLIFMQAQMGQSYAYIKEADGKIAELSFVVNMANYAQRSIQVNYKRTFKGTDLVKDDTKWQRSVTDVFYFTSADKIYRYNPLSEDLRTLDLNTGGKKVTMIKLSADGNTLTAGADGVLYNLDVSVGKNGAVISSITGIPGSPIDVVIRK